ncbi:hypothetical protein G8S49_11385 [Clostridium botulinum C]|uniref:Uncharacterized protein n=2 Tax=Clostridium botulinum TaxID=1491 RepID=A0A9Q4TME0_CLOBO|nr:hypothetical protein [Clostridium botulinum]EGO86288.1 hypothetical protein CBCST_22870 [Clostridium botulinum C str. Stockholm]MCD3195756.1 hypothetical protein [Clostridium botulinum C]MCD3201172.1 hypothetical protein [Clostridium botulinum C]MCD3206658.1 hypothetical protein [Clostridium botulinum C]MCD3209343.1 hypothetical protein [Clostridium botulinum C]
MAYKINFSIPESDKEVFEKLNSMKKNKSRYIVDLIKKDIGLIENNQISNNLDNIEQFINDKIQEAVSKIAIIPNNIDSSNDKNKELIKEAAEKDDDDFI